MHCQRVSSRSLSECSVVNLNVLLPAFAVHCDLRAVAACAVTGGGLSWGTIGGSRGEVCVNPPEIRRPPFGTPSVSSVSVGASRSPSVNTHRSHPPGQWSVSKGTSGLEAQQKAGTLVIWAIGLKQAHWVQQTSGRNKCSVLVSQCSSALLPVPLATVNRKF